MNNADVYYCSICNSVKTVYAIKIPTVITETLIVLNQT